MVLVITGQHRKIQGQESSEFSSFVVAEFQMIYQHQYQLKYQQGKISPSKQ